MTILNKKWLSFEIVIRDVEKIDEKTTISFQKVLAEKSINYLCGNWIDQTEIDVFAQLTDC